ncbi:acyltransferase [uncultured Erythrobacter sp.]|uniref:acyltransferase family protein n=1 Tax=uncultured Erythrobacter sp. TaxID=263913 RepID=UPI002634824F|nr:acyltransferase [uncultured Erythrobacter sp.]
MTIERSHRITQPATPHRFIALDSLRGIAALAIAYFHLQGDGLLLGSTFHSRLAIAVDFFFVLSGFVIFASYHERLAQGFSAGRFMFLRIARLWPLHVTIVLAFVGLELVPLIFGDGSGAFSGRRSLETLPANLLLLQTYVHPEGMTWNGPSWSISVELGLYVLAAILLSRIPRAAPFVFAILAVAAGITLMSVDWKAYPDFAFGATAVLRGIGGFGFGVLAAYLWLRLPSAALWQRRAGWLELATAAIALAVIAWPMGMLTNHIVFALMVFVFAFDVGPLSRGLAMRGFVWIGLVSYSIYLVHPLVYRFVFPALALIERQTGIALVASQANGQLAIAPQGIAAEATALLCLAAVLVAAGIAYAFIERPTREWSRRIAAKHSAARAEAIAPTI